MKNSYVFLSVAFIYSYSIAQETKCNRTIRFSHLKSKLDSAICILGGHQIMRIHEVDLNSDGLIDKAVRWQKINLSDGDTVFYSLYIRDNTTGLKFYTKLKNLEPLYFKNYDSDTGNKFYDSIKSIYSYPTSSEVEFANNSINLTFYVDAATIKKLFFTYSVKEKTWKLTREMQWLAPPKDYEGDEKLDEDGRKLEYDRGPAIQMRIDDFDLLKYIGS